jgi:methionyl aminopeptidase
MDIELLSPTLIAKMRKAGNVAASTLQWVGTQLRAGMSTADIDRLVRLDTQRRGARPSQLGFHGFPAAVCTSRNDVVCHGIPSVDEHLQDGDIIGVDVTSEFHGVHGDTCATFAIGNISPEATHVLNVARKCRDMAIEQVRPGTRLGDIGACIEEIAKREGCSVVRDLGGHGIGRQMHMPPFVPHTGNAGQGLRLRAGMAFTIEPMINLGTHELTTDKDGWTMRTQDGCWSAQFEHTILVTENGHEILTKLSPKLP